MITPRQSRCPGCRARALAKGSWLALALFSLLALQGPYLRAQAGRSGGTAGLLDQGLRKYEEGSFEEAVTLFEKAFAASPTSDAVLRFVDRASAARIFAMVGADDERISGIGRKLLELSHKVSRSVQEDPAAIQTAVEDALGAAGQDQLVKMLEATNRFGRNLVPALISTLADQSLARRSAAIVWIGTRIGRDAVPALLAARKHEDPTVRYNVARLLGARLLRDRVSTGPLKAMAEKDSEEEVRDAAKTSLDAILADLGGDYSSLSAPQLLVDTAYNVYYLRPHQNPFAGSEYGARVYRLEGGAVLSQRVLPSQLSGMMAKQALEDALELDPSFDQAQVLTLCNDAALVADYDLNAAHYAAAGGGASDDATTILAEQRAYVDYVLRGRLRMWPQKVLYSGLEQALADGKSTVARTLVDVVRETDPAGSVPEPLVRALEDTNSRLVRVTAAIAIAHWNPVSRDFDAGKQVVSILSEALLSSGVRTVQKAMGNRRVANYLDEVFRELNMETYSPIASIEEAVYAVTSAPPDLVVVDEEVPFGVVGSGASSGSVAPINAFVDELRKNYRSANVPVLVVVPSGQIAKAKDRYESAERKVWVAPDSIDKLTLSNTLLDQLFAAKDEAKEAASRYAAEAAEAVARLASVQTSLPVKDCVDSLRQALKNRPQEVRLPAVRALGSLRAGSSAGELAALFAASDSPKSLRVEAMRAVGKILRSQPGTAPGQILSVIEAGMKDMDLELRSAAWFAFGGAGSDGKRALAFLLQKAPEGAGSSESHTPEDAGGGEEPAATDADSDSSLPDLDLDSVTQ